MSTPMHPSVSDSENNVKAGGKTQPAMTCNKSWQFEHISVQKGVGVRKQQNPGKNENVPHMMKPIQSDDRQRS